MQILISGAGIAGCATAFWLSKLGHEITVIEHFPNLRTTGLQIDLRGHGIEVLKRMGLDEAFRSAAASEQGIQIIDRRGKRCAYFPANKSGRGTQSFTSDYEIMRGDLCRILHDACKSKVRFLFATSIRRLEEQDESVSVTFTNDQTTSFDLVIGADGQHSHTRKLLLGAESKDAFHPLTDNVAYFTIPKAAKSDDDYIASMYLATESRGIMTRRSKPEEIQVYLGCKANAGRLSSIDRKDVAGQKEAMAEIFQDAGWDIDEILRLMASSDNFYFERIGLVKMDTWSKGRVVLVGDAGYCPTVNTGMGTTSGMVGAYVLAGEIGKHCRDETSNGLSQALDSYQRVFQPFMTQVQDGVLEEKHSMPASAMGIWLFNIAMRAMAFLRINVAARMMKENVKGWDLPYHEEMLKEVPVNGRDIE